MFYSTIFQLTRRELIINFLLQRITDKKGKGEIFLINRKIVIENENDRKDRTVKATVKEK